MKEGSSSRENLRKRRNKSSCNLLWPRPSLPLFKTGSTKETSSQKRIRTLSLNTSTLSAKNSPKGSSRVTDLEDIDSTLRCKLLQPSKYSKCQKPWNYDYYANATCDESKRGIRICENNICHGFESEGQCSPPTYPGCKNSYTICGAELKARYDESLASQSNDNSKEVIESEAKRHHPGRKVEEKEGTPEKDLTAAIGSVRSKISEPSDIPIPLKDQFCFLCIEGDLIKRKDCPGTIKICGDKFLRSPAIEKKDLLITLQKVQAEVIESLQKKTPPKKNPRQRILKLSPVKDFFDALKKALVPLGNSDPEDPELEIKPLTFELDLSKDALTWEDFRNALSDYSYHAKDSQKNQKKVCCLLLMACYGLKPRDIFGLRWCDFNTKAFNFRSGSKKTNGLTELAAKLLYSLRESQDKNWKDTSRVFDFTERTLERTVKELVGDLYNPRDISALECQAPQGRSGEFHLARSIDDLNPPGDELMDHSFDGILGETARFIAVKEYGPGSGFKKHWSKR